MLSEWRAHGNTGLLLKIGKGKEQAGARLEMGSIWEGLGVGAGDRSGVSSSCLGFAGFVQALSSEDVANAGRGGSPPGEARPAHQHVEVTRSTSGQHRHSPPHPAPTPCSWCAALRHFIEVATIPGTEATLPCLCFICWSTMAETSE